MRPLTKIAWRNVRLHWRHSLMAIISIATGFLSLSIFQNYMVRMDRIYQETYQHRFMLGEVIVQRAGNHPVSDSFDHALDEKDQQFIENYLKSHSKEVGPHARFLNVSGTITDGSANAIFVGYGYDVRQGELLRGPSWRWNTLAGEPLSDRSAPGSIVMGQSLAYVLNCAPAMSRHYMNGVGGYKAEDRPFRCANNSFQMSVATESGQVNASDAVLTGIVDAGYKDVDSKYLAMPLQAAQSLFDTKKISYESVELKPGIDAARFAQEMTADAQAQGYSIAAMRWQDHPFGDLYVRTMGFLAIFRTFVDWVIVMIAGLSVFNTTVKSVTERMREIGTLRSVGYQGSQIVSLFMTENLLLSSIGVGAGLVATLISSVLINWVALPYKAGLLTEPIPFLVSYSPWVYVECAAVLIGISLFAAFLPSKKAVKEKIPELLAHT